MESGKEVSIQEEDSPSFLLFNIDLSPIMVEIEIMLFVENLENMKKTTFTFNPTTPQTITVNSAFFLCLCSYRSFLYIF